jgi:enoyl-CoA hydratase
MEFLLCADLVDAQRAYDMGLLNAVVPRDQLLDAAYGFARRMTANAPLAVKATKQSALQGLYHDEDTTKQLRKAVRALRAALLTVDHDKPESAGAAVASAADILEGLGKELRTAFEKESRLSSAIFQTEDAKEGPKAFAEKRAPIWQGR